MRSTVLCVPLLLVLALGCDKSGIHPLGRVRDNLGPCSSDTATWVRSTPEGTEIFLIGEPGLADDGTPTPRCFARGLVEHDSSTNFLFGTYEDAGDGAGGTFAYTAEYDFRYEPDISLLSRRGAKRDDFDPPITIPIGLVADGDEFVLTYATEARRLTSMGALIDRLDPTTQEGAEDIFRLFNLPLFTSQARILGFGSAGMTQYLGQTARFAGVIENELTVRVDEVLNPVTDIAYIDFMDLTGIAHDGLIHSVVNLTGDGTMEGIVAFRMEGATRTLVGAVDYRALLIRRGVAGGGMYAITIEEGGTYDISYELAADIDLHGVLPESAP